MSSNRFKDRIRIEAPGASRDPTFGTPLPESWVFFDEVWAEVMDIPPTKKSESSEGGIRLAMDITRIRIRAPSGVRSRMRVVELSGMCRTMNIVGNPATVAGGREVELAVESSSS